MTACGKSIKPSRSRKDILDMQQQNFAYELTDDFKSSISKVDAIYMTRIQDKWDNRKNGKKIERDNSKYSFSGDDLKLTEEDSEILHSLPGGARSKRRRQGSACSLLATNTQ